MNKDCYAILMAGGIGSRFWPVSTSRFPKQFHDMLGTGQTLIQTTFKRLSRVIPAENIMVLTNEKYEELVKEQLPEIKVDRILLEPAARNTAPCILYASLKLLKENSNANILVAPSDHWIEDEEAFATDVEKCFETCRDNDSLMTLGIRPSFANTGYGYIKYESGNEATMKVLKFTEKPDYNTAKSFLKEGNYLWNAGIFVWSAQSIVNAFKNYQPELFEALNKGMELYNTPDEIAFIKSEFPKLQSISIDYAILENSDKVYVLPAAFDWNDLGTWGSLGDELEKDENNNAVVNAKPLLTNAHGNIIRTPLEKIVIIDGLSDYIVVDHENILMVYPKAREQDIKQLLEDVTKKYGNHLS